MLAPRNERLFKVDLAATSDEARYAFRFDRSHDGIAIPSILQHFGAQKRIILVICVVNAVWNCRDLQPGQAGKSFGHRVRVTTPGLYPPRYFCERHSSECRLYLCHSPVCTERFVEPTKAFSVLAVVNGVVAFSVVFEAPRALPKGGIVGGKHSSFAGRRHNLVLAE